MSFGVPLTALCMTHCDVYVCVDVWKHNSLHPTHPVLATASGQRVFPLPMADDEGGVGDGDSDDDGDGDGDGDGGGGGDGGCSEREGKRRCVEESESCVKLWRVGS